VTKGQYVSGEATHQPTETVIYIDVVDMQASALQGRGFGNPAVLSEKEVVAMNAS
jgi:hypothetical protein